MSDIKELTDIIVKHIKARDWDQFHNPKDLAISLQLEASEVLEHFQWKNEEEIKEHVKNKKDEMGEELADTLYWVLLLSNKLNIDIKKAFKKKMVKNEKKYPVDKSKGKHNKYTDYN